VGCHDHESSQPLTGDCWRQGRVRLSPSLAKDMEVIELSDDSSDGEVLDRRGLLAPVVGRVVDALGGCEGSEYVIGDQANGCLKDLKKLWRKDETDDERTVARLFWEMRVLPNDLVAILLQTAGKGLVEDKRAINCVDLMTAMTWPIDLAEELKELDEELDKGTDYTQLMESHLHYKAALLQPGVMQGLFGIMLGPLAKLAKERTERDGQVINVVLHLIRNLAFIKDLPSNHLGPEFSTLQSKFIRALSDSHTFDLLLTIATNADNDPLFNGWNTLVLETFYLFFRGVQPSALAIDQAKVCVALLAFFR
jgi:replication fork protection complex subunit Tof1/Swi1